jgi:hypothetical protein
LDKSYSEFILTKENKADNGLQSICGTPVITLFKDDIFNLKITNDANLIISPTYHPEFKLGKSLEFSSSKNSLSTITLTYEDKYSNVFTQELKISYTEMRSFKSKLSKRKWDKIQSLKRYLK